MGEILEVTRHATPLAFVVACAFLASCGSQGDGRAAFFKQGLAGITTRQDGPPSGPQSLTRAKISRVTTPLIVADVEKTGAWALMVPFQINGDVVTWSSTDDRTVALRDGILVATRGLGPDLMSAEVPSASQIASGSGSHRRVNYLIDGLDQTVKREFRCTLATNGTKTITIIERNYPTRHVLEHCEGATGRFTNEYWVDAAGSIRQSLQTFDRMLGKVRISRAID
ncbi:YjbF family lipoprotein [Cereibacter azotoformans]|uniref:Group 4 capsule polysaccharide lipoprotein GfcB/YjbF n=1 Tax=Cereibacter azotoformans TaxID=43057 RepID=A0A2T5K843_9RHOB|nr:YjbF family lipoprotein [Cereibacter azotoformans]AXQ94977.1 YjbF family lipoprotein [Cereibacter sphaeroides]MBO4170137.1 YjbF family lipoprotein [Cereibacter azotoformans]PTR18594.1 group 4 capsule polysaccharide lipoprotein GfcB/YjbF [Cereibacter azotoformans]UIJ30566.1 YjbF family lipoprotein [Cereibacter azotoformans]ULB11224.1 YjbF family lipoprotein [Cereibacter azotoformans]